MLLTVNMDYPDEDIEEATYAKILGVSLPDTDGKAMEELLA